MATWTMCDSRVLRFLLFKTFWSVEDHVNPHKAYMLRYPVRRVHCTHVYSELLFVELRKYMCHSEKSTLTVKLVFTALGATSSSSATAAGAAANPPAGNSGASGRFNRFFNTWLSSDTSSRFRVVISATNFSILGDIGFSTPAGTGMVIGDVACTTSWCTTALEKWTNLEPKCCPVRNNNTKYHRYVGTI